MKGDIKLDCQEGKEARSMRVTFSDGSMVAYVELCHCGECMTWGGGYRLTRIFLTADGTRVYLGDNEHEERKAIERLKEGTPMATIMAERAERAERLKLLEED